MMLILSMQQIDYSLLLEKICEIQEKELRVKKLDL